LRASRLRARVAGRLWIPSQSMLVPHAALPTPIAITSCDGPSQGREKPFSGASGSAYLLAV